MPTIVTRGLLSARGGGAFSSVPPPPPPPVPPPPPPPPPPGPPPPSPTYQTVAFNAPGTYSWTAPGGVTNLTTLTVRGGSYYESPGQWVRAGRFLFTFAPGTSQPGNPASRWTYAEVNNYVDSLISSANSGGTGERSFSFTSIINYYNSDTGGFYNAYEINGPINIRGDVQLSAGPGDNRSNEIVYPTQFWTITFEIYIPPEQVNGTPSSAFGYTAQGGTSGTQPQEVTQYNIPVVPGRTYTITVGGPSNDPQLTGGVVFQFFQS